MSDLLERLARARAARAARAAAPPPETVTRDEVEDPLPAAPPQTRARSSAGPDGVHCRSCGARIVWGIAPSGARTPMDQEPVTVVLFGQLGDRPLDPTWQREAVLFRTVLVRRWVRGREVEVRELATCGGVQVPAGVWPELPRVQARRSHFSTCPHADAWRARR